jgi:hypothetical protein
MSAVAVRKFVKSDRYPRDTSLSIIIAGFENTQARMWKYLIYSSTFPTSQLNLKSNFSFPGNCSSVPSIPFDDSQWFSAEGGKCQDFLSTFFKNSSWS